jgi:2-amino-1-hydroxyethylphosphonate dioxygenase (glycine-forming)
MKNTHPADTAAEVVRLYKQHGGGEYAGEAVTQLEHACQCAVMARQEGCDDEMVLAAFLHDIGHICVAAYQVRSMDGYGVMNHEKIGAAWLRNRKFSERLITLVSAHVSAKRYLVSAGGNYYEELSEASKKTLEFQGGPMTAAEAAEFEQHPLFEDMLRMRRFDEAAKITGQPLPAWDFINQLI